MIDPAILAIFIPTFFFVSVTPGMCMTLSLTLGMTVGVRRALWMMAGELVGVGLVSASAVIGVAALMMKAPEAFTAFKYVGGGYLVFLGVRLGLSRGRMAVHLAPQDAPRVYTARALVLQGFVTAVANPKAWAFMVSLLPPFIDPARALAPQLSILLGIILATEFVCLLLYASGGRSLRRFLDKSGNVRMINRIAGALMVLVGIWLIWI
ncbi:LysE family translocator [Varunaivibrio sulfuroxidans]|uniref:Threonine/homoserine/homoserine lactone efflux protein n=1 Tax=Varunaivibrio sulfuroxidans TaxID=1773489 RepID=A0A4R3J5E1_9PROT|nr:LysE family translocator [Varunaivibrio sulfuroxidans]TCS60527.1 threonine/homoserine/homoserine lactone efflux protein [Varunaivibrio sulfuroxidans]WES30018.1 LysE family translocator [Varunaivibrio sulfuroxidans]